MRIRQRSVAAVALALVLTLVTSACTTIAGTPTAPAGDGTGATTGARSSTQPDLSSDPDRSDPDRDASNAAGLSSSRELIDQALAAGEIDEQQALAYRVLVQFNDPRIPAHLVGAPTHDLSALARFEFERDSLRDDVRAAVDPYLMRPTDPDSAYAKPVSELPAMDGMAPGLRNPSHAIGNSLPQRAAEPQRCAQWATVSLDPAPFRLWLCADADANIPDADELLDPTGNFVARVRNLLIDMTLPRPQGMGEPIPDRAFAGRHPDEDESIDIYILDDGYFAPERNDGDHDMVVGLGGLAVPSAPFHGVTSSGHVLIASRMLTAPDEFLSYLAHEAFHVLQFARNLDPDGDADWLVESSAQWAGAHYAPGYANTMHVRTLPTLQASTHSIPSKDPSWHPYDAYLWHLFVRQEAGLDAIFDVWDSIKDRRGPGLADTVLDEINRHTPWETSLPEFAMRLLNAQLPGDPISPRFVNVDPNFPDGIAPDFADWGLAHQLDDAPLIIDFANGDDGASGVAPLAYQYRQVTIAAADDGVSALKIEPDDELASLGTTRLEALVQGDGGRYQRHVIDLADGAEFCDATDLILVLSNASRTATVNGSVAITRESAPECALAGGLNWHFSGSMASVSQVLPWPYQAEVQLDGTLHVVTAPRQTRALRFGTPVDPDLLEQRKSHPLWEEWSKDLEWQDFYPDDGSTWEANGRFVFKRCDRTNPSDCWAITTQDFSATGPVNELEIVILEGEPVLRAAMPATTTIDSMDWGKRTEDITWRATCPTGGIWWDLGGDFRMMQTVLTHFPATHSPRDPEDLVGAWSGESRDQLMFDCQQAWTTAPEGIASHSARFEISGQVTLTAGR